VKPKHLLLAPPLVWSTAGLALLFDGKRALDYFPYFWAANDLAVMAAFAGVMLTLFGKGAPEPPGASEWPNGAPLPEEALPLEELLVEVAARLEREAPPI
jgi:hypothetical protein